MSINYTMKFVSSILIISSICFSGCGVSNENFGKSEQEFMPTYKEDRNIINVPAVFDCEGNREAFKEYTYFFKDKNYDGWCQDCLKQNGKPQLSQDAGPYCNLRTTDGGKPCIDKSQCEGTCIAESKESKEGKCAEFKHLEDGCGWLELIDGTANELCVS